ncbi:MAG: hypothetical protein J6A38_00235 [Clostridia bacterium]|nr:hypothetical protein [Clostridia bacterium]
MTLARNNQFLLFCLCIGVGFVGGIVYELFSPIRKIFRCDQGKCKALGVILDVSYCVAFAGICIFSAFLLHFPDFRVYMCIGYGIGGIIYLKSLRKVFAFLQNMCYNIFVKVYRKRKKKEKALQIREEKV